VASIAILNLDEAGDMGAAAAMAVQIGMIYAASTVLFAWLGRFVEKRTQV
jgi:iron(III) transport system permease protein